MLGGWGSRQSRATPRAAATEGGAIEGGASDIDVHQRPRGGACCVHVRAPWWARAFAASGAMVGACIRSIGREQDGAGREKARTSAATRSVWRRA